MWVPSTIALVDNASYHKTKKSRLKLTEIFYNLFFIPPYTPLYAPIELFFNIVKMKLNKHIKEKAVNLNSTVREKKIKEIISLITKAWVIGWFKQSMRNMTNNASYKLVNQQN